MIEQPLAEFAIAQYDAPARFQRELCSNDVIGEGAGAQEEFDIFGANELAKDLAGCVEILHKSPCAMGFGGLFKGAAHLASNGHRPGKKIDGAGLESARG